MIPFLIVTSIFSPPFIWLLIFWKVLPPEGKSLEWARSDLVKCTLKHPGTYIWAVWALLWISLAIVIGF